MKCPICKGNLEQETYYDHVLEDTQYYNYCESCGWDDYPEYLLEETEVDNDYDDREELEDDDYDLETEVILGRHPYLTPMDL